MYWPNELVHHILSQCVDARACRTVVAKSNDDHPNREALAQATGALSAMTACKQWRRVAIDAVPWRQLYKLLDGNHRRYSEARFAAMSSVFYRCQVFCTVEQVVLERAVHDFVAARRLVYRSPKVGRVYDTARLGIRKLKKLGKQQLVGQTLKQFVALVRRYEKIHGNYLKLECRIYGK